MKLILFSLTGIAAVSCVGCAASPYDFPNPTMVGAEQGYSMTGYMATDDPQVVRERLEKRMEGLCPNGVKFVDLTTRRADAAIGTKILNYEAVMKCTPAL